MCCVYKCMHEGLNHLRRADYTSGDRNKRCSAPLSSSLTENDPPRARGQVQRAHSDSSLFPPISLHSTKPGQANVDACHTRPSAWFGTCCLLGTVARHVKHRPTLWQLS